MQAAQLQVNHRFSIGLSDTSWNYGIGTVVVDVLFDHLNAEDEAQFRQRFQMYQVDDVRPQEVVEQSAQLIQIFPGNLQTLWALRSNLGWAALL